MTEPRDVPLPSEESGTEALRPTKLAGAAESLAERAYVSRLWADDWDSPEDSVYDEIVTTVKLSADWPGAAGMLKLALISLPGVKLNLEAAEVTLECSLRELGTFLLGVALVGDLGLAYVLAERVTGNEGCFTFEGVSA